MKKLQRCAMCFLFISLLCGCQDAGGRLENSNQVANTIEEQIAAADTEETASEQEVDESEIVESESIETEAVDGEKKKEVQSTENETAVSNSIDIDLTEMSSDMVYATVYQMMCYPENYIGKTIRMEGQYYSMWYEPTSAYYYYIIISDAAACCAQGLEFLWDEEAYHNLQEKLSEEMELQVTGTFETYEEEENGNVLTYCRLKDTEVEIVE